MLIHRGEINSITGCVVTVGSFDGVHFGHRHILRTLKEKAKLYKAESMVITLFPHPRKVLNMDMSKLKILNTLKEKEYLIERCQVDHLFEINFTEAFSQLSGEEFVKKYLVDMLQVKAVIIGYDHMFGHDRKSGFDFLNEMSIRYGFDLFQVEKHDAGSFHTSSTSVRAFLEHGDIKTANSILVDPYFIICSVSDSVCNIDEPMKLIPPKGVYAVEVLFGSDTIYCDAVVDEANCLIILSKEPINGEVIVKFIN